MEKRKVIIVCDFLTKVAQRFASFEKFLCRYFAVYVNTVEKKMKT